MKKWIIPGILAGLLFVGTLLVLGCYFISEISAVFTQQPVTTAAFAATSTQQQVTTTTTDTTDTTETTESTETTETTESNETTHSTSKPPATSKPTTKPSSKPSSSASVPDTHVLSASHAFVYDMATGKYLYTYGDKNEHIAPASITKLFSAYVALQYLSPETVITAGEEVSWIDPQSSRAWIYRGQRLKVQTCIEGMIIPSGNDAAYILAVAAGRAIAGDAQLSARSAFDTFVAEMNRQAQNLGLSGTHFKNPDGIDEDGHYTTLADLVAIGKLSLNNTIIAKAAATNYTTGTYVSGESYEWSNSNLLIRQSYPQYYTKDACGLKTGSTQNAGNCLLSAFKKGDSYLLICVMGCPQYNDRFDDTLSLYNEYK